MSLSQVTRFGSPSLAVLAVAAGLIMLGASPASAQSSTTPRVPPDARGYQATMIYQQASGRHGSTGASRNARPAYPTSSARPLRVVVTVSAPPTPALAAARAPAPEVVSILGPDGTVRSFPLAGGEGGRSRVIVVRPGESATISVAAFPPARP